MSLQDPNQASGPESTQNHTPVNDQSRKGTSAKTSASTGDGQKQGHRRLGVAISAVGLALLSFVVGLLLFTPPKRDMPADELRLVSSSEPDESADQVEQHAPLKENVSAARVEQHASKVVLNSWAAVQKALIELPAPVKKNPPADGKGPEAKNRAPLPAEFKKIGNDPKPALVPWPPETIAFAGREAGDEWSANGLQMKLCWCPAGMFTMGSPEGEKDGKFDSGSPKQVAVTLTKGFWLAKYELTQWQWERVMGTDVVQQEDIADRQREWEIENAGHFREWWDMNRLRWRPQRRQKGTLEPDYGKGPNYPIYYVNHLEATDFCRKLTEQERKAGRLPPGWEYRLPTEAQWEYACRAGTKTATAFGDRLSCWQANFDGRFPYNGAEKGPSLARVQSVGMYKPNAWGLCDMHGNASEWCRDWTIGSHGGYPGGTDPEVKVQCCADRVVRGGGWRAPGKLCRSATHLRSPWSAQDPEVGFRVALVLLDPQPKRPPEPIPNPNPLPAGILTNSIGMKLAPIPAGRFLMGSPVDEPGRPWLGQDEIDWEQQHAVTIREPFYLGVYLVTQEQYQLIMGNAPGYKPSYFSKEGEGKAKVKEFKDTKQFPRENISWKDAQEFCRRLSELPAEKQAKRRYRLPTEAEWEYACRAGTTTPYYFGKTITPKLANFRDSQLGRTTSVGQYAPNQFGLYDMHGNLYQWCEDRYEPFQEELRNPDKERLGHVLRGGAFDLVGSVCRSAYRSYGGHWTDNRYGFRIALSVDAVTP